MFDLTHKKVIVIGGSSGLGLAIAKTSASLGAHVTIASRNLDKLDQAKKTIGTDVTTQQLDISQPEQIKNFFQKASSFDHLITSSANVAWGPFTSLSFKDEQNSFNSKFWGQYYAAKFAAPKINHGGSIIFFSGAWSQRPIPGAAVVGSINGAIESLGKALAIELAPIRINVISPGIIDTPIFAAMTEQEKKGFFETVSKGLPVKKIGKAEDVALTAIYLMTNTYTTGSTLYVDGGETLR